MRSVPLAKTEALTSLMGQDPLTGADLMADFELFLKSEPIAKPVLSIILH